MDVREKLEVIAHLGDHITYKEDIGICYDSELAKVIEDAYMTPKNGVTVTDNNVGGKWIPVTERLPENDQWALCFMKDKSFGTFRVFQWNYIDWQWNDGNEWYDENDVTHWMPLPEPPKGE